MPLRNRTKEELEALRNAAPILERITYQVMFAHFKKEAKQNPTELNKSIYAILENKQAWDEIRHLQAQNTKHNTPHEPIRQNLHDPKNQSHKDAYRSV
jgi:hypothetical protein